MTIPSLRRAHPGAGDRQTFGSWRSDGWVAARSEVSTGRDQADGFARHDRATARQGPLPLRMDTSKLVASEVHHSRYVRLRSVREQAKIVRIARSADALGKRHDDPFRPTDVGHPPHALELADATDQFVS